MSMYNASFYIEGDINFYTDYQHNEDLTSAEFALILWKAIKAQVEKRELYWIPRTNNQKSGVMVEPNRILAISVTKN